MNIHKLACLTPFGREVLLQRVRAGVPVTTAAGEAGVSRQTVYNWCRRAEEATRDALRDRASTPQHSPPRLVSANTWSAHTRFRRAFSRLSSFNRCSSATPTPPYAFYTGRTSAD